MHGWHPGGSLSSHVLGTGLSFHTQKIPHLFVIQVYSVHGDFTGGASGKEPTCRCRRHKRPRFYPWVGKIPLEEGMAKSLEPRGFSRIAAGFSSSDGDLSLPLGLAPGSPIFPSGCQGNLGVALESLQG